MFDRPLGYLVKIHYTIVVRAPERIEEAVRYGKEWRMLDVRIMLWGVGNNMVDIVATFPPAHGEASHEVSNENANTTVDLEVVRYAHVAEVVSGKGNLVPEEA